LPRGPAAGCVKRSDLKELLALLSGDLGSRMVGVGAAVLYRDESITVQLGYDDHGRLQRVETDMTPFKSLQLPFISETLYWAK
jgi:protein-arginine kinase